MKVVIEMEIETEDYGGIKFMREIKKLIMDIDPTSYLVRFKMYGKYIRDREKDIDWKEKNGELS